MIYTAHDGKTFTSYESLCEHEMFYGPNKEYWTAEYKKCKQRDERIVKAVGGQENASIIGKIILTIIVVIVIVSFIACLAMG